MSSRGACLWSTGRGGALEAPIRVFEVGCWGCRGRVGELRRRGGGVAMERGAGRGRGLAPAALSGGRLAGKHLLPPRASTVSIASSPSKLRAPRGLGCGPRARRWRWSCGSSGTEGLCGVRLRG